MGLRPTGRTSQSKEAAPRQGGSSRPAVSKCGLRSTLGPPAKTCPPSSPLDTRRATSPLPTARETDESPARDLARLALKVTWNRRFGPLSPDSRCNVALGLAQTSPYFRTTGGAGSDNTQINAHDPVSLSGSLLPDYWLRRGSPLRILNNPFEMR